MKRRGDPGGDKEGSSELVTSSLEPACAENSPLNLATKSTSDLLRRDGDIVVPTAEWLLLPVLREVPLPGKPLPTNDLIREDPSSSLWCPSFGARLKPVLTCVVDGVAVRAGLR